MFDIFVMDMGGHDENRDSILRQFPHAQPMRYIGRHLDMIARAATKSRTEFFWVISSCCDYSNFDFNYIPKPWEATQIHCWASGNQKFGDTFLVNVDEWNKQKNVAKLEWYHHINYHADGVPRLPWPTAQASDNLAETVLNHKFESVYTTFYTNGSSGEPNYDMDLWEKRDFIAYNKSGHVSVCPRDAKQAIKTQIYDWHYIKYVDNQNLVRKPQDIVFISYDEENADQHWEQLKQKQPSATRIHGVKGLFNALQAAAQAATTDWFYAVFAKTEIDSNFKFDYQPDYLRHPANYVFQAYNPILKTSYGHGAIVLHNRRWLLENTVAEGADITMSMPVVSVPIVSCVNHYNETPWSAYRTAFREAYKLKQMNTIDSQYHLHLWTTSQDGDNGQWSKLGACDGVLCEDPSIVNNWEKLKERFNQYGTT